METMETITYKGVAFEAEVIGGINSERPWAPGRESYDTLLRDEAGRYYLLRETANEDIRPLTLYRDGKPPETLPGKTPTPNCVVRQPRRHLHLISLNAAILWATTQVGNGEYWPLYLDASNLLTPNRGVNEPPPFPYQSRAECKAATVESDPHPDATLVRELTCSEDGARRFVFTYPPSEYKAGKRLTVEVTAKQWDEVNALAAHFKMSAPGFLRLLVAGQLPDQPTYRHQKLDALDGQMLPEHIVFACSDEAMTRRIERAAQARRQTVDEFIAEMVGSHVDMWEECMIVHPKTGELLREDDDDLFLIVDDDLLGLDGQSLMRRATDREDACSTATSSATVRGLVSPEIFEGAARYTAEHGRTVEETVAELLKGFAEQAPHATDRRHAGRSEDIALLAAFAPTDEGDESDDGPVPPPSLPTGDDGEAQGTQAD